MVRREFFDTPTANDRRLRWSLSMGIQRMHTRSDAAVAQNNTRTRVKHRHCPKYDPFRPIGSLSRSEHTMMNIPDPVSLSEVKHHEVLSVLWWGTTREYKISL